MFIGPNGSLHARSLYSKVLVCMLTFVFPLSRNGSPVCVRVFMFLYYLGRFDMVMKLLKLQPNKSWIYYLQLLDLVCESAVSFPQTNCHVVLCGRVKCSSRV